MPSAISDSITLSDCPLTFNSRDCSILFHFVPSRPEIQNFFVKVLITQQEKGGTCFFLADTALGKPGYAGKSSVFKSARILFSFSSAMSCLLYTQVLPRCSCIATVESEI
jgi:hypothetical protein